MILACVYQMTRPSRCFCGTVLQPQLATPLVILAKPAGILNSGLASPPPASSSSTLTLASSLSRAAAGDDVVIVHLRSPQFRKSVLAMWSATRGACAATVSDGLTAAEVGRADASTTKRL